MELIGLIVRLFVDARLLPNTWHYGSIMIFTSTLRRFTCRCQFVDKSQQEDLSTPTFLLPLMRHCLRSLQIINVENTDSGDFGDYLTKEDTLFFCLPLDDTLMVSSTCLN